MAIAVVGFFESIKKLRDSFSRREESCKHKLSACLCVRTSLIDRRKM